MRDRVVQGAWKGGAISDLTIPLKRAQPKIRTSEQTVNLIRRLVTPTRSSPGS
jgi:hypothetical protein